MYVRVLTGRYAGEIRDIRPDAAKLMLADGRAIAPDAPWFASGGIVSEMPVIVGETVSEFTLPPETAERLARKARRSHG